MIYSPFTDHRKFNISVTSGSSSVASELIYTLTNESLVNFTPSNATCVGGSGGSAVQTNTDSNPAAWARDIYDSCTSDINSRAVQIFPAGTPIYGVARQDTIQGVLTVIAID